MQYLIGIILLIVIFVMFNMKNENKPIKEKFISQQIYQKINNKTPFVNDRQEYVSGDDLRQEMIDNSHTKQYDNEKLNRYRNDFFDFRNHTQLNSHQTDTVDKINLLSDYGNGDMTKTLNGMSIREVYNQLTKSEYK
jgi:hypothetical protein